MKWQIFIHLLILKQHIPDVDGIFFIFENLGKYARLLKYQEVSLMPFMGIAA